MSDDDGMHVGPLPEWPWEKVCDKCHSIKEHGECFCDFDDFDDYPNEDDQD